MQIKEEGNYKIPDWKLEVRCTGKDWLQKQKPCYSLLIVEDGDILKRSCWDEFSYGCICPKCKCFTEIPEKDIPDNVKMFAPQVAAKGSDDWFKLSDEEKKLSEDL